MQQNIDYEKKRKNTYRCQGKLVQVQDFLYTIINKDYDQLIEQFLQNLCRKYKDLNKDICKVIIYGHNLQNTAQALNILYAFDYFYIGSKLKIEQLIDKNNDNIWDCYFIMCFYQLDGNQIQNQLLYKKKFEELLTLRKSQNLASDQRQSEIKLQNFRNANQIVDFFIYIFENDNTVTEKNRKKHFVYSYNFLKEHNMIKDIKDKTKKLKINIINAYLTKDYQYLKDIQIDDKNSLAIILYQLVTVDYKQFSVFLSRCNDKDRKYYIQHIKNQVDTVISRDYEKLVYVGRSLKKICEWEKTIDLYDELIKSSENHKNIQQYNVYLYFTKCKIQFLLGDLKSALETCKLALLEIEKFIKQNQNFYQPNPSRSLKMELLFLNLVLAFIFKDDNSKTSIIDQIRQINQINETKLITLNNFNLQLDGQGLDKLKRILKIFFQFFVDDIEAKDVSKIQHSDKTFGIVRDFFEKQIPQRLYIQNQRRRFFQRQNKEAINANGMENKKDDIKLKTQCLLELFTITQLLKNQDYQIFVYYLNECYQPLLLKMITLKNLAIEPVIQASIFSFFGEYDQCFQIAQKLNNNKLMAEVYFSQMNDDKAIEYYEKVQDAESHFLLGSLYLNKAKQILDRELQLDYVNKSKRSFEEAKLNLRYHNKLREMLKNSKFQEELEVDEQQSKQYKTFNNKQNRDQSQLDTISITQGQKVLQQKVRDDIINFQQFIIKELAPQNQKLISQIEKLLLSTRRFEIESKRLIEGMKIERQISDNVKQVIFEDSVYTCKISSITFDPTTEQFGGQQLEFLYSQINQLNILIDIQDYKIPYVIQIKHIGFQTIELNDSGLKKIEIFYLSHIYQPFQIIQAQSDKIKLQFAEKIAICLKQLNMKGIPHYDIKPENVLVDEKNYPVLINFHFSIQNSRSSTNDTLNNSQIYQDQELEQSNKQSLIKSFGNILYELFVCRIDTSETEFLQNQNHIDDISKIKIEEIQQLIYNCTSQNSSKGYQISQVLYEFLMMNPCRKDIQELLELFNQDFQDIDITDQEYELIKEFQQISQMIQQKEMLQLQQVELVNDTLYKCLFQQTRLLFHKFQIKLQDKQLAFRQILQCMRFIRNHLHLNEKNVENIIEFYNYSLIIQEKEIQFNIFGVDCDYQMEDLQSPLQLYTLLRTINQINEEGIFMIALEQQLLLYDNTPILFNFLFSYVREDVIEKNQLGWLYQEKSNDQNIQNEIDMIRVYFQKVLCNLKRKSQLTKANNIRSLGDIISDMNAKQNQFSTILQMIEYLIELQITKIEYIPTQNIRSDVKQFCQIAYKYLVPQDPELNTHIQKFIESSKKYKSESSELESCWQVNAIPIASGNNRTINQVFLNEKEYVKKSSTISFSLEKQNYYEMQGQIRELKSRLNEINIISEIQDYKIPYVLQNVHIGLKFIQENNIQRIEIYNLNPIYEPFKLIQEISDQETKMQYIQKVALCLKQLQMKNITHQDIKPDNLMVNDNFDPVIIDFGISVSSFKSRVSLSKYWTLQYADPELVSFGSKNRKNDVYSFGITLYELFTRSNSIYQQGKEFLQIQSHQENIKSIKAFEIQDLIIKCTQAESKSRFSLCQVLYQFLMINLYRKDIRLILILLMDYFDDIDITEQEYELIKQFQEISLLIPQMDSEEIKQVENLNDNLYKCQYQDTPLVFNKYEIVIQDNKKMAFRQLLQCMRFVRNLVNLKNVNNISQFYNYRLIIQVDNQEQSIQFEIFMYNNNYQMGYLTTPKQIISLLTTIQQINENGIFMMEFSDKFLLYQNDQPIIINFLYSFRQKDDLFKNLYGWPCKNSLNLIEFNFKHDLQMILTYLNQISQNNQSVDQLRSQLLTILETYSNFTNIKEIVASISQQIKNQLQSSNQY